jgi:hypothetical protein
MNLVIGPEEGKARFLESDGGNCIESFEKSTEMTKECDFIAGVLGFCCREDIKWYVSEIHKRGK